MQRMMNDFEQQLKAKDFEISELHMRLNELQRKHDMTVMELNAVRDASDRSNSDKIKEIEDLKR